MIGGAIGAALADAQHYARAHRHRHVDELCRFVRFASVSADPGCTRDVAACATWLVDHLRAIGLSDARLVRTPRHPIVLASWRGAPGRPTVLIYGHYDVQPPDPLSAWHTPPFEAHVAAGAIHGRGASDDKGQLFCHVKAIECYLRTGNRLPVNVVCMFEGEEEVGSTHLKPWLRANGGTLSLDAAVISDTAILGPSQPAITISLRGGLALELRVSGPSRELHAGAFGGAVHNPIQALCEIIGTLHAPDGTIAIDGIYDDVRSREIEPSGVVRPTDGAVKRLAGVRKGWGEPGFSLHERRTIRPAVTINGIHGGYTGPGAKAVIPSSACAKLSLRLVPNLDPSRVLAQLSRHLRRVTPPTVKLELRVRSHAWPFDVATQSPIVLAAAAAYWEGWGVPPRLVRSGGTIPVASLLSRVLEVPTVLMGFALPDDGAHAPNERFRLVNFRRGITAAAAFLAALAERPTAGAGIRRPKRL